MNVSVVDAPTSSRPRSLWWVYLLVTLALAGMGAGVAEALFVSGDLGGAEAFVVCLTQHGLSLWDLTSRGPLALTAPEISQYAQYAACAGDYDHRRGVVMLVGAAALPVAAWLLMLCGGLGVRWGLRRSRAQVVTTRVTREAISRFEAWCDAWALTGRRRPRLLLAAPGTSAGQAFTTGLPLARPLVVVPLSYAYAEPAQFDVVVLHELAHVRSRDLLWASAVWWAGWLSVPALLLALVPMVNRPQVVVLLYGISLGAAVALSVAVLVLRAALLRQRELAADRYAIEVLGDAGALRAALGQDAADVPDPAGGDTGLPVRGLLSRIVRVVGYARRLTDSHPSPAARANADLAALGRWEGGFAFTAAVGLVAMITFQSIYSVLMDLLSFPVADPGLPSDLALAAACLLWSAVVVPAWTRRVHAAARTGAPATWWGPWAGALVGLIAGYCLQIPGASIAMVGSGRFTGHLPLLLASLAIITAGISVLTTAVATRLAGRERPPAMRVLGQAGAVLAVAAALTTAWGVTVILVRTYPRIGGAAEDRILLSYLGDDPTWRLAPLLVLAGLVITVSTTRPPGRQPVIGESAVVRVLGRRLPRACVPVMVVAVVTGGLAAALSWKLRIHPGEPIDTRSMLVIQRLWICALAGWTAMGALLLAGQPSHHDTGPQDRRSHYVNVPLAGLPAALIAGFVTAALAGLMQFLGLAAAGTGRNLTTFQESLRLPLWMLFVASVVTLPWLVLGAGLTGRARRHSRHALGTGYVALGTASTVGLLALALASGVMAPVIVTAHDYKDSQALSTKAPTGQPSPTNPALPAAPEPDPHHTADPGRPLDQAAVTDAIANIPPLLPANTKIVDNGPGTLPEITPTACRDTLTRDVAAEKALPRTATITRTYNFPEQGITPSGVTLTLTVNSYVTPQRDFTQAHQEAAACAHFSIPAPLADRGHLDGTVTVSSPPDLPYPTYREDMILTGRGNSILTVENTQQKSVLIGHNLVSAAITYGYIAVPPPASVQKYLQQLLAAAPATIIENLRSTPPR